MHGKGSFYIAQYPVRWTAQSSLHFLPSLADLFIPTSTRGVIDLPLPEEHLALPVAE